MLLPKFFLNAISRSSLTLTFRNWLFRDSGTPLINSGQVVWEGYKFSFTASFQSLYHAQVQGIESRICRVARASLGPGDTAIDAGTSFGFITVIMGLSVQPGGRVLGFELSDPIRDILKKNISDNNLEDVALIIPKGVGATPQGSITTIDDTVFSNDISKVKFLKIDVDGGDFDVLKGAKKTVEKFHPVIVIEMSENEEAIYNFLKDAGYTVFIDHNNQAITPGKWPPNLYAAASNISIPSKGSF